MGASRADSTAAPSAVVTATMTTLTTSAVTAITRAFGQDDARPRRHRGERDADGVEAELLGHEQHPDDGEQREAAC